ncbi:MAG: carotenoid oxygenase family protein [Rhodospirillales bacterium]
MADSITPWVSSDPHLSGGFAPVFDCLDRADLPVVQGAIPPDLEGAYFRNGPNPAFEPLSYTYPFDGDGMVHAVYLSGGKARYRNRFVETRGLKAERRAGRALYGGIMAPRPLDPALVGPDGDPGPFKNGAFIHIVAHAGRLLAPYEVASAYEMTWELETRGEWLAGGDTPLTMGAHVRRHPKTGDLFAIAYGVMEPLAFIHRIDPEGTLRETRRIPLAAPTMLHDFVLTERHLVLLAGPAVFDLAALQQGGSMLQWRPELGTRIAVIPLDGRPERWLEAAPSFAFHLANGFERGSDLVLDYVRHERLNLGVDRPEAGAPPRHYRMTLSPTGERVAETCLSDLPVEFPRIDQRFEALATTAIYSPTRQGDGSGPPGGAFNAIARFDGEGATPRIHDFGAGLVGEAAFIPKPGSSAEGEGYLAVFLYDSGRDGSDFVLLDAQRLEEDPVAVVRLPRRVPQGLHGSWIGREEVWV